VTTSSTTAPAAPRGPALGIGEARAPQPFTIEQRLLDAVRRDDRATVKRALERGATVHAKDDLGRTTVLLATKDVGDLDLIRWLRARGAALDEPDVGGRTALSFAAEAGRLDIVRYLVENGAVVDRRDREQRTALFHAALGNHPDVIAFLADRGADVNARDQWQDTPLIVACAKGNAAAASLLLARGADPSLRDQEGRTARDRSAPGTEPCRRLPAP
jgi:ankyrin repeat protein